MTLEVALIARALVENESKNNFTGRKAGTYSNDCRECLSLGEGMPVKKDFRRHC